MIKLKIQLNMIKLRDRWMNIRRNHIDRSIHKYKFIAQKKCDSNFKFRKVKMLHMSKLKWSWSKNHLIMASKINQRVDWHLSMVPIHSHNQLLIVTLFPILAAVSIGFMQVLKKKTQNAKTRIWLGYSVPKSAFYYNDRGCAWLYNFLLFLTEITSLGCFL